MISATVSEFGDRLTSNQREGRDLQRLLRQAKQDHLALGLEESKVRVHGHACGGRVYNAMHCALHSLYRYRSKYRHEQLVKMVRDDSIRWRVFKLGSIKLWTFSNEAAELHQGFYH